MVLLFSKLLTDRLNSDDTRFGTKLATFIPSLQSANDSDSWTSCFTRTVRSTGDAYVLAVKIAVEEARDVDTLGKFTETVEDENGDDHEVLVVDDETKGFQPEYFEIVEQLLDDAVTTTIINTKMAELRNNCGLIIYDESLESSYTSTYTSDYKNTKKSSKTVVAELNSKDTVEGIEFVGGKFGDEIKVTAQDMFDDLSTKHGVLTAVDAFQFEYMLYSSDNKILDYAKYKSGKKAKDCLLPADESKKDDDDYETPEERWDNIVESVKSTKVAFSSGSYEQYGYPATYGWKNFMKEFFGNYYGVTVNNEEELKIFYLYQEVVSDYSERIAKTDEAKWKNVYIPFMQQKFDDFFSANGVHLLISVTDKEGNISDPNAEDTAWTEIQKTYAEELYQKVFEVLKCTKANEISTVLEQIVDAFDVSPKFVADYEQVTSVQVERTNSSLKYTTTTKTIEIEVAKYKTAGLNVKFEDLGTITQGQMVENFENAVKALWNDRAKDSAQMNKGETDESLAFYDLDFSDGEYLCTEYGYHVLTVTSFTARTTANKSVTTTGDDGTESTKTEATIVKPLSLKDLEDIISVYENDTEDIDDTYQLSQISNFFTNIKSDFTSSYYYQYTIMNEFLNIIDSFEFNGVGKEDASRIVSYYKDTYCTSMTYIKNDYDTAINLMKIAANAATLNNCDAETLSIIKEAAQAAMADKK